MYSYILCSISTHLHAFSFASLFCTVPSHDSFVRDLSQFRSTGLLSRPQRLESVPFNALFNISHARQPSGKPRPETMGYIRRSKSVSGPEVDQHEFDSLPPALQRKVSLVGRTLSRADRLSVLLFPMIFIAPQHQETRT